jgi:hypothetical protein
LRCAAPKSMAKENENRSDAKEALPNTNEEAMQFFSNLKIDDNKENEGVDNPNSLEIDKVEMKSETKSDVKLEVRPSAKVDMISETASEVESDVKVEVPPSADIDKVTADLLQSRTDLLGRVQNLKKDLQDWRGKLDSQVKTYRQELGELRTTLNTEVEQLRNEFQALRTTLKKQLDATNGLAELGPRISAEKAVA